MLQTINVTIRSGFSRRGGGGGRTPLPRRFDQLPTQRVHPLVLFKKSMFDRPTDPKTFLKYIKFGGGVRAKKDAIFWSKISKKCLKTHFFGQNFACSAKIWSNQGLFSTLGVLGKSNLEKRSTKFLNIQRPPPLEKILDPPLNTGSECSTVQQS